MKRFYENAVPQDENGGFAVLLDDRRLKSPAKHDLILPTRGLADVVANEWQEQGEEIVPATMPMMQLSSTAIDRVLPDFDTVARDAAGYGMSDLLFYRADTPADLSMRQAEGWQPVVDWAEARFSLRFTITTGLMPVDQPPEAETAFLNAVSSLSAFELASVHVMTTAMGSLLLALTVAEARMDVATAFELSRVDETHQQELWGVDEEAEVRRKRLLNEMSDAERFLSLVR